MGGGANFWGVAHCTLRFHIQFPSLNGHFFLASPATHDTIITFCGNMSHSGGQTPYLQCAIPTSSNKDGRSLWRVSFGAPSGLRRLTCANASQDIADNVELRSICALGAAAAWPIQGLHKHFREEMIQRRVARGGGNMQLA